jgi:hypothetical protein
MDSLPQFILDLMAAGPPVAGQGVNLWLFRLARVLHAFRSTDQIADFLRASTAHCGRTVTETEIQRAIENSRGHAWHPGHCNPNAQAAHYWPQLNAKLRAAILARGFGIAELWEASPIALEDASVRTEEVIDKLFPGNPLLCCGKTKSDFRTLPREQWRGTLSSMQLIVPNVMSKKFGITKDGKKSQHSLANTDAKRHFLVVEFDSGSQDDHAAILMFLADHAPLTLAVHSGSRSLHGWFYCLGQSEARLERFMRKAVSLGADPATWLRSQFVRMPDGSRDNGARQTIFFFNPHTIKDPQ